jgi:hypothetical protein
MILIFLINVISLEVLFISKEGNIILLKYTVELDLV